MDTLKILFPAIMVLGALGSLVVNLISIGATLLYTALMLRNTN